MMFFKSPEMVKASSQSYPSRPPVLIALGRPALWPLKPFLASIGNCPWTSVYIPICSRSTLFLLTSSSLSLLVQVCRSPAYKQTLKHGPD